MRSTRAACGGATTRGLARTSGEVGLTSTGTTVGTTEVNGQQIVIRQSNLAGLNVTRKVFLPADGYFARYLETLARAVTARSASRMTIAGFLPGDDPDPERQRGPGRATAGDRARRSRHRLPPPSAPCLPRTSPRSEPTPGSASCCATASAW